MEVFQGRHGGVVVYTHFDGRYIVFGFAQFKIWIFFFGGGVSLGFKMKSMHVFVCEAPVLSH